MSHATLLALLLPPQSYARNAQPLQVELHAEGHALDVAERDGLQAAAAISPFFAEYTLPDWERVCDLTPAPGAGYQQRLQAVLAKLAATGGLSIPYFQRLASSLGYRIDIVEPQPFRAGINRAATCCRWPTSSGCGRWWCMPPRCRPGVSARARPVLAKR
ncbi:putative phage tail protein [Aquitalea pelogenes]|uniref:putative phage tail protein n=1 Tax=Aquitalea pelogenes TaxID=1293573 RepID=UPI000AEA9479|nr:putative phage tail protein [Aquitalea pelogenes]